MGNGRNGLSRTTGTKRSYYSRKRTPKDWNISVSTAKQYGINIAQHKKVYNRPVTKWSDDIVKMSADERMDRSLQTLNEMGRVLGLQTDELPKVELRYGEYNSFAYGNFLMNFDPNKKYDGHINVYSDALYDSPSTTPHEFMHALEAKWIREDFHDRMDIINAWADHVYAEAISINALKSMGALDNIPKGYGITTQDVWQTYASTLYRSSWEKENPTFSFGPKSEDKYPNVYGASQYAETITTAMQNYIQYGKNASPYAKAIVKELQKEVKRHRTKQKWVNKKKSK